MVLKQQTTHWWHGGKRLHVCCWSYQDRALWAGRVQLGRLSGSGKPFSWSPSRELLELVQLYSGDGIEIGGSFAMTVGKRLCMVSVQVSWDTQFWFIAILRRWSWNIRPFGHNTRDRDCMVTVNWYHGIEMCVFVCSLIKYLTTEYTLWVH